MLSATHLAESSGVIGPLTVSSLISCLEDQIEALLEAGEMPILVGGLPELLMQAVDHLRLLQQEQE